MIERMGMPVFLQTFDDNGLRKDHSTKMGFSDISIVQAKLRNAGYTYDDKCKCWTSSGQEHLWSITRPFGQNYELLVKGNKRVINSPSE